MRRVLIDECLPVQLHLWLEPFESRTVAFMGWKGLSDAELLQAARGHFEVLVTSDGLLPREHDLAAHGLGVVIVPTNLYRGVHELVPAIADAVRRVQPGDAVFVTVEVSTPS
jgi:hypothetical protein